MAGFSSSERQWSHTSRSCLPRECKPAVAQHGLLLREVPTESKPGRCICLLLLQSPQFAGPVHKSAYQPVQVGIAGTNFGFDSGNLPAGACYCFRAAWDGCFMRGRQSALLSGAICSKVRPSASRVAFLPLNCSHRCTMTSTYLGSSSIPQQVRSVSSAAASVVPLPKNGS